MGLSGPGHRKPLTTGQRPDISATSSIRVPHLHRPASSRLRALFPANERDPAPQKLRIRCGPLHPCMQCCPDILCRDLSSTLCGSLPARPPGACIPLQLGLSVHMLWLQCMLAVPGCLCCLLCMPASKCIFPDIRACACGHASRVVICFQALSALCRPPSVRSAPSTILGFSHSSTSSSIF